MGASLRRGSSRVGTTPALNPGSEHRISERPAGKARRKGLKLDAWGQVRSKLFKPPSVALLLPHLVSLICILDYTGSTREVGLQLLLQSNRMSVSESVKGGVLLRASPTVFALWFVPFSFE